MQRDAWVMLLLLSVTAIPASFAAQTNRSREKGGIDITGPYSVVENWFKPLHEGRHQCVVGVFAENPNRIYLITEVEVASTFPPGNCASERNVGGSHRHFILVLNGEGQVIEEWSQWNALFGSPHSIKISPHDAEKHVWIVNSDAHQIHEFTRDGKRLVMTLGEKNVPGNDDKHFNRPTDVAFFPDGSFVVTDGYNNSRVVKFDANGAFLKAWGTNGSAAGQFRVPHGVAIDSRRRVYVADRDNERVQVFDENGGYLDEWPNIRGVVCVMATEDEAVWALTGTTNRLLKYDLKGHLLTYWGTANIQGVFPGSLYAPHAFSVDADGNLYIADYRNHRVQKFTPKPGADRTRLIRQPSK
jgi:NHL repeat